jgi:hypothetical protein
MTLEQTILSEISELPDNLKQDVANYVAFLKTKYSEKRNTFPNSKSKNEDLKKAFKNLQKSQVFNEIDNPLGKNN